MQCENSEDRVCKSCGKTKPIESFYRTGKEDYLTARCRECIKSGVLIPRKGRKKSMVNTNPFGMAGVRKEDYENMFLFLKEIGYDLTKPIHQQFCEKYGLKEKERLKRKQNKFTPESFGLV